jgi:hypothetical protein
MAATKAVALLGDGGITPAVIIPSYSRIIEMALIKYYNRYDFVLVSVYILWSIFFPRKRHMELDYH